MGVATLSQGIPMVQRAVGVPKGDVKMEDMALNFEEPRCFSKAFKILGKTSQNHSRTSIS